MAAAFWVKDLLVREDDAEAEERRQAIADEEVAARVVITQRPVTLTHGAVRRATVRHDDTDGLALTFRSDSGTARWSGPRAEQGTAAMLAHLNAAGAPRDVVDGALDRLVAAGSPEAFLAALGRRARWRRDVEPAAHGEFAFAAAAPVSRLALEMALNDARERRAMDGELRALEDAWREAEEIAAIADDLALPGRVRQAFDRLRARRPGGSPLTRRARPGPP
jgi:hypothetical protein